MWCDHEIERWGSNWKKRTEEKLFFSDCHNHSVSFFSEGKISHLLGGNQGMQDGFTVRFQSPTALVSYGESVFVFDTSNQAYRLISSLTAYKFLGEKLEPFMNSLSSKKNAQGRQTYSQVWKIV